MDVALRRQVAPRPQTKKEGTQAALAAFRYFGTHTGMKSRTKRRLMACVLYNKKNTPCETHLSSEERLEQTHTAILSAYPVG